MEKRNFVIRNENSSFGDHYRLGLISFSCSKGSDQGIPLHYLGDPELTE